MVHFSDAAMDASSFVSYVLVVAAPQSRPLEFESLLSRVDDATKDALRVISTHRRQMLEALPISPTEAIAVWAMSYLRRIARCLVVMMVVVLLTEWSRRSRCICLTCMDWYAQPHVVSHSLISDDGASDEVRAFEQINAVLKLPEGASVGSFSTHHLDRCSSRSIGT